VVILSTHIVQDVMELCTNTAIIDHGGVMFAGAHDIAIRDLEGKIWQRNIAKSELQAGRRPSADSCLQRSSTGRR
jgi:ABC-2 type transport system ATP-binding protein